MSRVRATDFEERDYYPAPRRSAPEGLDEVDYRRRTVTISPPPREESRTPAFLREDIRRTEAGPMVLRQRQVETIDRHRPRSPSPVRVREERIIRRPRSISPESSHHSHAHTHDHEHEHSRTRVYERERVREPSQPPPARRAPSPARVVRYVERPQKSPSPPPPPPVEERERIRTRIIERERAPSPPPVPKPSPPPPPPPPQTIRGPTIEREVITHYRDIDHGMIKARPPTPPPQPKPQPRAPSRVRERETDIDISLSKNRTEVDISRTTRTRSQSQERRSDYRDDELVVRRESETSSRRRAHSAAPLPTPNAVDEEGDYLTGKIDSRGRMGEAWGGATKDWTLVDVPPGTERIRMDGIGGGSTETSWARYTGSRKSKFIPERDGAPAPAPVPSPKPAIREPSPPASRDRVNVSIYDREREIDIERTRERVSRPAPPPPKDMWTEITKDLVLREAIESSGYEYEETKEFYYIMDYLKYDDVLRLVDVSDEIRKSRKQRARELEYEREYTFDYERDRSRHGHPRWDEVSERETFYDTRPPRGYLR